MTIHERLLSHGDMELVDYFGFWEGPDNEKTYKNHLKTKYELLEENNWIGAEKAITYEYNKWGFRNPAFDSTGGVMFLGCSCTVGVGLPSEDTFAHIVSQRLGLPMYRMGVNGSGNDAAFRVARHWVPILKPKHVVLFTTFANRMEIVRRKEIYKIRFNDRNRYMHSNYYKDFDENEPNRQLLMEKNIFAIQGICLENNVNFVSSPELNVTNKAFMFDWARDLLHFGRRSHVAIADIVTDILTTQNNKL